MATVILARHGRTTANASGILAGRSKGVHLDEVGTQQANAAAARLEGLPVATVITSPMERCRETAKLLVPGARAVSDKGLNECDYGSWSGRPIKELAKEPMWRTVQLHPAGAVFPDGETMAQMSARAIAAIRDRDRAITAEHGPEAVWVAVSHGDVIKAILADALGMHLDTFQRIIVDPASLSVVRYTEHRPFVVALNTHAGSLAHLTPPKKARRRSRKTTAAAESDATLGGGAGPETAR